MRAVSGRTPTAKVVPPASPPTYVTRPAALRRLDAAAKRRLTAVVAGPGWGKSTLVAGWTAARRTAWYTIDAGDRDLATFVTGLMSALRARLPSLPGDLATVAGARGPGGDEAALAHAVTDRLAEALAQAPGRDLLLVLDDLHELLPASPSADLVEGLCRQAQPWLHVVVCSREDPPFAVARLRGQGEILDVDATALAFSEEDTGRLLDAVVGSNGGDLAAGVHALTGGWPVAVRLAAEAVAPLPPAERVAALDRLRLPGGGLLDYLAQEVIARSAPEVTGLLRAVAPLARFKAGLCRALGVPITDEQLAELARRGLFLAPRSSADGWFTLHGLVRDYAREHLPLDPREAAASRATAVAWLLDHGHGADALEAVVATGERAAIAAFVARHGGALLDQGAGAALLQAAALLPHQDLTGEVAAVIGAAHHARGEWDRALAALRRVAPDSEPLPAATAWRMGIVHHLRGELDEALATYARGRVRADDPDAALLLAWTAAGHWLRGEASACRDLAVQALDIAEECGDDQALAAAHTTLALLAALDGDRHANDAHYLRALDAAERADDPLQRCRIHANRGSRFLEEGSFAEALSELDHAVRLGELTGFSALLGLALNNRGEVHLCQGHLDDALADYQGAVRAYQRAGSRLVSLPLSGLGDVYRERGELVRAQAAYREALELAEAHGDVQALVAALTGLARTVASDDPEQAAGLAAQALACGPGLWEVGALLAAGWVALARQELGEAGGLAAKALALAGSRGDRPGQAEALELAAQAADDPHATARALDESAALWREVGSALGLARTALARARLRTAGAPRAEIARAEAALRKLGVRVRGAAAGPLPLLSEPPAAAVTITALGGLRVLRSGRPVPLAEWGSRKARELLKMLVARRGRPVPREALQAVLWPDGGAHDVASRLSVMLSTVRGVLDPARALAPDYFVRADADALALDIEHAAVDVERFLASAAEGLERHHAGDLRAALPLLVAADDTYAGDFLEEDPYSDWAVGLREQARATAIAVARAMAEASATAGDHDAAVRALLRLLVHDPYDESAHLVLVRTLGGSGRRGEAHRRYRMYVDRMTELEIEAAPFPQPDGHPQPT